MAKNYPYLKLRNIKTWLGRNSITASSLTPGFIRNVINLVHGILIMDGTRGAFHIGEHYDIFSVVMIIISNKSNFVNAWFQW